MALQFTASTGDNLNCGSGASIDGFSAFSLVVWLNLSTFANFPLLASKEASTAQWRKEWSLRDTGQMHMSINCSGTNIVGRSDLSNVVTVDKWWYIAYTSDGSFVPKLYIGDLSTLAVEVTGYDTQQTGAAPRDDSGGDFIIGNNPDLGDAPGGNIAYVTYCDSALSLSQIQALQYKPNYKFSTQKGLWLLHDPTGDTPDLTGNGNTGTPTGLVVAPHVPLGPPFGADEYNRYLAAAANLSIDESESVTFNDSPTFTSEQVASSDESIAVSDSPSWSISSGAVDIDESESIAVSDSSVIEIVINLGTVAESITVSDSPTAGIGLGLSNSESISIGDSPAIAIDITLSSSESITVADSPSLGIAWTFGLRTESITLADSPSWSVQSGGVNVDESESIIIGDSPLIGINSALSSIEGIGVSDSPSIGIDWTFGIVTESIVVSDSPEIGIGLGISVSESITIGDSLSMLMDMALSISESITIGDSPSWTLAATVSGSVADSISLDDSPTSAIGMVMSEDEVITLSDSPLLDLNLSAVDEAESISFNDAPNWSLVVGANIDENESISVSDSPIIEIGLALSASESITVGDSASVGIGFAIDIADVIGIDDIPSIHMAILTIDESESISINDTTEHFLNGPWIPQEVVGGDFVPTGHDTDTWIKMTNKSNGWVKG
jgi:hypothetical protein